MISLMYHDVVAIGHEDESGFPGRDAARYKITPELFDAHLGAIDPWPAVSITFDDGGVSALRAADALERHGRRGCFFITAHYVGTPGFVDTRGIRELSSRGHGLVSHPCLHPR